MLGEDLPHCSPPAARAEPWEAARGRGAAEAWRGLLSSLQHGAHGSETAHGLQEQQGAASSQSVGSGMFLPESQVLGVVSCRL